jgi:hypothetical protein
MGSDAAWVLAWLSLGIGLLGLAAGLAGPQRAGRPLARLLTPAALGVGAALLAFLCTLGREYPYEPGGRLGVGILLGGGAGLLYLAVAAVGRGTAATLAAAAQGAALAGASAALLVYRGYPNAALLGVPFGMGILLWFVAAGRDDTEDAATIGAGATVGVLAAVVLAAGVTLAIERYGDLPRAARLAAGEKVWWAFPLAAAGAALLGQLGAGLFPRRPAAAAVAGGLLTLGLLALLLSLLRGGGPVPASGWPVYGWLLLPLAAGWISALLLWALAGGLTGQRPEAAGGLTGRPPDGAAALAVVVLLALLGAAYRMPVGGWAAASAAPTLGGLGLCIAALGFLGGAPGFLGSRPPQGGEVPAPARFFTSAAGALALASLFRLFYVRYDLDDTGIRLAAHYVLLGLLGGAALPLALGIVARRVAGETARGAALALLSPLAPVLLVVFFGIRAGGGILVGMTAGMGLVAFVTLLEPRPDDGRAGRIAAAVPVTAVLLAALFILLALTPLDFYATHWPRALRIALAAALALGMAAWGYLSARRDGGSA